MQLREVNLVIMSPGMSLTSCLGCRAQCLKIKAWECCQQPPAQLVKGLQFRFIFACLQVISMSSDSIIKLWDLRNNRCMQTIAEKAWPHPSHAHPAAMLYEPRRRRVVTIEHQPMYWKHMCCADDQQGHSQPLVAVLYSPEFHLVRPQ